MAIPISWPSSEEVDDSHRALDILLEQLLVQVRHILVHRRRHIAATTPIRQRTPVSQPTQTVGPTATTTATVAPPAPHPRLPHILMDQTEAGKIAVSARPETETNSSATVQTTASAAIPPVTSASAWIQTGAQLRHIADSFRVHRQSQQDTTDGKVLRTKDISLLALLCPAVSRSLWTTLALLLGWGFFARKR